MDGGIEAAGDITTGALLGRAIEPPAGDHSPGDDGGLCLNCGTARIGPHCHRCGQSAHVHRSIGAIGHELLHGVVHFEGKLWRTLPLLAWRPGELTRRYIAGERARFVSPMALFLFSIFTMFAVFQIMGLSPPADVNPAAEAEAGLERAADAVRDARDETREQRAALAPGDPRRAGLDDRLAQLDGDLASLGRTTPLIQEGETGFEGETGWPRLDHGLEKWKKNPGLMLYKLQSNSYKFSWLLIPLSLPFMWLLFFWKRGVHVYDHAVFVTYSIGFMSLLFIALTIAGGLGASGSIVWMVGLFVPIWHIYRQMKGAYALGRVSALLRTGLLLCCIAVVLILFLLALLGLGLVG